jgi:hypothetical protein
MRRLAIIGLLTLALAVLVGRARAEEHGAPAEHGQTAKATQESMMFDAGEFDVVDFHPTHQKMPHIRFVLALKLDESSKPAERLELADWKQRIRDQAIIAVRMAEPHALAEPSLNRVRRIILLRLRRLPLPAKAVEAYITDFAVTEE